MAFLGVVGFFILAIMLFWFTWEVGRSDADERRTLVDQL